MEEKYRLTNSYEMKQIEICNPNLIGIGKEYKRLYEYENTNLSPQEVEQLKKENEELKSENNEFCSYNKKIREENLKLKAELEELKKNAIVPKFNVGDEVYSYFLDYNNKRVIKKTSVLEITINKTISYSLTNGGYKEEEKLFYTRKEAEEALRKLEENKND